MAKDIKSNPEYQRAISQVALRKKYPQMFSASGELKKKYGGTSIDDNKEAIKKEIVKRKAKRNLRETAIEKRTGLSESELRKYR